MVAGLAAAVVSSLVAFGTVQLTNDHQSTSSPAAVPLSSDSSPSGASSLPEGAPDIHALLTKVGPSVVAVEIGQQARSGGVRQVAAGSGVVISSSGLVLTNAHVVDLTDQFGRTLSQPVITVKKSDGSTVDASILGTDAAHDIAVLKLASVAGLTPATLGSSSKLQVGDDVVAIGNAFDLGDTPTVTSGIVSATDRSLQVDSDTTLTGLIQTDAAINHGNSGGPLIDASGDVVGINSAGIPDAQNLGFAIAIDSVRPIVEKLAGINLAQDN
jgi:S1-C subfamily serine protease